MRLVNSAVFFAVVIFLVPQVVVAADLEQQVEEMKQRIEQMENELQQQDQQWAAVEEERSVRSSLSSFLEKTEFSGFVAAGWNWGRVYDGADMELGDSNTFQLDQAWIEMSKAATEESRVGFNLAFEMGAYATQGGNGGAAGNALQAQQALIRGGGGSNTPAIYSAYVSYLAPLGNGLQIDAGIIPSVLGAEVENQNGNWQISRGLAWALRPVTGTGATATYNVSEQLSVMIGALNDPVQPLRRDSGTGKGLTSQVKYQAEKFSLAAGVNYGHTGDAANGLATGNCFVGGGVPTGGVALVGAGTCTARGLFDLVAKVSPMKGLDAWVNYDYLWADNAGADGHIHAIAFAARYDVMDMFGLSGRFEYIKGNDGTVAAGADDPSMWEITATIDRQLTDNLTAKVEYRHDKGKDGGGLGGTAIESNAIMTQIMYQF